MFKSLLPPNATQIERAVEEALSSTTDLPVSIDQLKRAETCPSSALPALAWEMSVNYWDESWPEVTQRAVIAASIQVHRKNGVVSAIRRALKAAGYGDAILVEGQNAERYNDAFSYDGSETHGEAQHWAEYSVFVKKPLSIKQANILRAILEGVTPQHCQLKELNYVEVAHVHDSVLTYDGTFTYGVI
ncbi:phage tail protein I [Paracoccaceae bacterium GXU_MW_L88]